MLHTSLILLKTKQNRARDDQHSLSQWVEHSTDHLFYLIFTTTLVKDTLIILILETDRETEVQRG